jgi:hypothetical protein
MPAFLVSLLAYLIPVLVSAAGKILLALGIGVVSFAGVSLLTDQVMQYVQSNMSVLPNTVIQFLTMFKMLTCLNIILSAYVGKFTVQGIKKFVIT